MQWTLKLIPALALSLAFCTSMKSQDSPSLGDLARQAQKDKADAPPAKVFTNEDLPSGSGVSFSGMGSGTGRTVQPGGAGKPVSPASSSDELQRMGSMLDQLGAMDRATLAKDVLQGDDKDFPGRAQWEEKLFNTKQIFVTQGRNLLQRAEQIQASAKNIPDVQNPNDPRVKDLSKKLQQLVGEATGLSQAFQDVVKQGRDLAGQAAQ